MIDTNLLAAVVAAPPLSDQWDWTRRLRAMVGWPSATCAALSRTPYDPSRPLAFMHVPKSAGTSLIHTLGASLQPSQRFGGFDRSLFGDFDDFAGIDASIQDTIHLQSDRLPAADLIAAHMAYSSLRAGYPQAQLMTILREPVSRLVSQWLYWRGQSDAALAPWGKWGERVRRARLPLGEFLHAPDVACQTDNVALRMLLCPHKLIPPGGFIDPRHDRRLLGEARDRLATFALVDCIENPKLPEVLQGWLGRPFTIEQHNVTERLPERLRGDLGAQLTPDVVDLVLARVRLDLRLWIDAVRHVMPDRNSEAVRKQTLERSFARHSAILAA